VAEACSGLRSLTALISLGVLLGGIALRHPLSRVLLIAIAIPVAILINGVRVFLTGFLVFFVSPELGQGFMHTTEGWLLFVTAFAALGVFALVLRWVERRLMGHEDGPLPPSDDADAPPAGLLPDSGSSYAQASANA
ncbi:MAG TPA: exosortase/archaeosortase family protein, partial [Gemmatimonadaceae bacterium]|nr:exosortase/archaeosortase family protein [Gemmatimonadaceae bacterium]